MMEVVKRHVDGDAIEIRVLGAVCYTRVGLISVVSVLGWEIYHRIDTRRSLFGFTWERHAA